MKMASTKARKFVQQFNKKRNKMRKEMMNIVANQMSSNQVHDPSSIFLSPPLLSSMATTGLEFKAEILWDYLDLDRVKFLNAGQDQAGNKKDKKQKETGEEKILHYLKMKKR